LNSNSTESLGLTSVGPEYDIVFVGIISALEEIEEKMPSFNINVSGVSPSKCITNSREIHAGYRKRRQTWRT
jgi:hypothetical protein